MLSLDERSQFVCFGRRVYVTGGADKPKRCLKFMTMTRGFDRDGGMRVESVPSMLEGHIYHSACKSEDERYLVVTGG